MVTGAKIASVSFTVFIYNLLNYVSQIGFYKKNNGTKTTNEAAAKRICI